MIVGGAVAGGVVLVILIALISGGESNRRVSSHSSSPPSATPPSPRTNQTSAETAIRELSDFARSTEDPDAVLAKCEELHPLLRGTQYEAPLQEIESRALAQLKARERARKYEYALREVRKLIAADPDYEREPEVRSLLEAVRKIAGPRKEEVEKLISEYDKGKRFSGLVGRWLFDEGKGMLAADASGRSPAGRLRGPRWTTGKRGGALEFRGGTEHVELGMDDIEPPWTAAMWVTRRDVSGNRGAALMDSKRFSLRLEQCGGKECVGFTQYRVKDHLFNYVAPEGKWIHLAFVGTAVDTSLYVNGEIVGKQPSSISLPMATFGSPREFLNADLDAVHIFRRALDAAALRELATGTP